MSDLQREKFEKWAVTEFLNITKYGATGVYCYPEAHLAWTAWQAAIESAVVDLSKIDGVTDDNGRTSVDVVYRGDVERVLDKAGVKYE